MAEHTLPPVAGLERATHAGAGIAAGTARWLGLAAAPAFALMALWTGPFDHPSAMLCTGGQGAWSPDSMALMYALMSVVHVGPWLKAFQDRP